MNNRLKVKDVMLIALLTALFVLIYMLSVLLITPLGALGHSISPGICYLLGGTVLYFMSRKIGKMWQFTLMTLLMMGAMALFGGSYLPWFITSALAAIIADFIASGSKDVKLPKLAVASGIMAVGQIWGAVIPAMFFASKYKETWVKRGQTAAQVDAQIKYTSGAWGVTCTIIVFVMAFIGIYLGHKILKKHFKEA